MTKCAYCGKEFDAFWIPVCDDCWDQFEQDSENAGKQQGDTRQTRVEEMRLTVCESGHVTRSIPTGRKVWIILHDCGEYTREDGNYCQNCGGQLE